MSVLNGIELLVDAGIPDKTGVLEFPMLDARAATRTYDGIIDSNWDGPTFLPLLSEEEQADLARALIMEPRLKRDDRTKLMGVLLKKVKSPVLARIVKQSRGDKEYGSLHVVSGALSNDPVLLKKAATALTKEEQASVVLALSQIPFQQAHAGRVIGTLFLDVCDLPEGKDKLDALVYKIKGRGWFNILNSLAFTDLKEQLAPCLKPGMLGSIVPDLYELLRLKEKNPKVDKPEETIGVVTKSESRSDKSNQVNHSQTEGGKVTVSEKVGVKGSFGPPGASAEVSAELGISVEGSFSSQWGGADTTSRGTTTGETRDKGRLAEYYRDVRNLEDAERLTEQAAAVRDYVYRAYAKKTDELGEFEACFNGRCRKPDR
jgi:hypothetical protein